MSAKRLDVTKDALLVEFRSGRDWHPYKIFTDANEGLAFVSKSNKEGIIQYRGGLVETIEPKQPKRDIVEDFIQIPIDLSDDTIVKLSLSAHERDIKLNDLIIEILDQKITNNE